MYDSGACIMYVWGSAEIFPSYLLLLLSLFSFVDVTGSSDGFDPPDPFSQTRVGNESNPFIVRPSSHVSSHDDGDDDNDFQEFNER